MPTYEYECRSCQHTLEALQSFSEDALTKCPNCKKNKLFRVISGGNGFFMAGRTVGAIADKNTDKYSEDFQNHLNAKNETKKANKLKLKDGQKIERKKSKVTPLHKKLSRATPEQRQRYIDKGTI
jgi:putative FmdB family regulatory protein